MNIQEDEPLIKVGGSRVNYSPIETDSENQYGSDHSDEVWISLEDPVGEDSENRHEDLVLEEIVVDFWRAILLRIRVIDIIPLALASKTTLCAYETTSIYKFHRQGIDIVHRVYRDQFTDRPKPQLFRLPDTLWNRVSFIVGLCRRQEQLAINAREYIKTHIRDTGDESLERLTSNEKQILQYVLNDSRDVRFIPIYRVKSVFLDAIDNAPLDVTESQEEDLRQLADYIISYSTKKEINAVPALVEYLKCPHKIPLRKHYFKNIYTQLLSFVVLLIPVIYLLNRYWNNLPSGVDLRKITSIDLSNHHDFGYSGSIPETLTWEYPYVNDKCIDAEFSYRRKYGYSLSWRSRFAGERGFCWPGWDNSDLWNTSAQECVIYALSYFVMMNVSKWMPFILAPKDDNNATCMHNINSSSITCGASYHLRNSPDEDWLFYFATANYDCMNNLWILQFGFLLAAAIIGSTAMIWGLGGYIKGSKYNYIAMGVGLVLYAVTLFSAFLLPTLYHRP